MSVEPNLDTLEGAVSCGTQQWHQYRAVHGEWALSSYLFMVEAGRGFPVLVKSHTVEQVNLIILQTGVEFSLTHAEFERHRGKPFVLRPTLRESAPEQFDRCSAWFAEAYAKLGLAGHTMAVNT